MTARLKDLLEEVRQLTPEEQQQLRQELDRSPGLPPHPSREEELDNLLVERGLLSSIPPSIAGPKSGRERKLVQIEGKPLSETIIEDRR